MVRFRFSLILPLAIIVACTPVITPTIIPETPTLKPTETATTLCDNVDTY